MITQYKIFPEYCSRGLWDLNGRGVTPLEVGLAEDEQISLDCWH